jgi:hypothetical protein
LFEIPRSWSSLPPEKEISKRGKSYKGFENLFDVVPVQITFAGQILDNFSTISRSFRDEVNK